MTDMMASFYAGVKGHVINVVLHKIAYQAQSALFLRIFETREGLFLHFVALCPVACFKFRYVQ